VLEVKNLHSGYGALEVLKGVSLSVGESEIVSVIGPNGSGKTTILKSIFNLADVSSGSIEFGGKNITKMKTNHLIALGISYLPQNRINFHELTVEENLVIGADHLLPKEDVWGRLKEVYGRFPGLRERKRDKAYQLSGGQQQMLAFGRALMHKPSVMLLGEPSIGLSPSMQNELFSMIKKLKGEGVSTLMVEQNVKKALEVSDRTYFLDDEKLAQLDRSQKKKLMGGGPN